MPYNGNIPQPTDRLRNSQNDLLQNFMAIDSGFSLNHVGLNEAVGQAGKHKFLTMPAQSPAPALPSGTDLQFYVRNSATSGQSEFYFQRSATPTAPNVANNNFPWTLARLSGPTLATRANKGYTYLPCGLLMQWATAISGTVGSALDLTFPITFNSTGVNYNITISVRSDNAASNQAVVGYKAGPAGTSNETKFQIIPTGPSGASVTVFYIAIGL